MKRLLPILISLLHSPKTGARGLVTGLGIGSGAVFVTSRRCRRDRIAMDGASPGAGSFPTARMRSAEENSRQAKLGRTTLEGKVGALAGPPCRSRGSTRETKLKTP
jgi:hypothetical protein